MEIEQSYRDLPSRKNQEKESFNGNSAPTSPYFESGSMKRNADRQVRWTSHVRVIYENGSIMSYTIRPLQPNHVVERSLNLRSSVSRWKSNGEFSNNDVTGYFIWNRAEQLWHSNE